MNPYRHQVSSLFAHREGAENALDRPVGLGWGASLGGPVGASAGAQTGIKHKDGWFSDLVRDAIASGQVVLVAETLTEQETASAREVIEAAVGAAKDVSIA